MKRALLATCVVCFLAAGIATVSAGGQVRPVELGNWAQESFAAGYVLPAPHAAEMVVTQSFSLSDVVASQLIVDQRVSHNALNTRTNLRDTDAGRYLYELSNLIVGDLVVYRPAFDFKDRPEHVATNPTMYVLGVQCRAGSCIGGSVNGKPYSATEDSTYFASREKAEAAQKQIRELVQFATGTQFTRWTKAQLTTTGEDPVDPVTASFVLQQCVFPS